MAALLIADEHHGDKIEAPARPDASPCARSRSWKSRIKAAEDQAAAALDQAAARLERIAASLAPA